MEVEVPHLYCAYQTQDFFVTLVDFLVHFSEDSSLFNKIPKKYVYLEDCSMPQKLWGVVFFMNLCEGMKLIVLLIYVCVYVGEGQFLPTQTLVIVVHSHI